MEEADEMDEEDFDILDTRCRSQNAPFNQLVFAFNPPEKTHWIPKRWFKMGNIMPEYNEPLEWSETINDTELRHLAIRSHYKDNPFLPADSKAKLEKLKEHNYSFYEKLCLGTWMSGIEGSFFNPKHITYGSQLGRNIIYFDPAYSQVEGQGDYTCILKTSFINNKYHINNCVLKQNMTPNEILENVKMLMDENTLSIHYDAAFSQKSFWNHARYYSKINLQLIEETLTVDKLISEAMFEWCNQNIVFPQGFEKTDTGMEALKQLYNFQGKKKTKTKIHDDFPDALICSVHLLNKFIRKQNFLKGYI
jgi:hypothetical protein